MRDTTSCEEDGVLCTTSVNFSREEDPEAGGGRGSGKSGPAEDTGSSILSNSLGFVFRNTVCAPLVKSFRRPGRLAVKGVNLLRPRENTTYSTP